MNEMKGYLRELMRGEPLSEIQTFKIFDLLMEGTADEISDAQIGAYFFGTDFRLVNSAELVGAARSLRTHMVTVDLHSRLPQADFLDTCGTGGSGLDTFNTSTAAAFVCAAAGQYVAKHGNRGATSKCGSADILEALGIKVTLTPSQIIDCCVQTKFCFMFAPLHHPATARVGRIRKELGVRTIFNFLGPLVNPAMVDYQLLGVSKREMVPEIAEALSVLGAKRALVVNGGDGIDELTLTERSQVIEVSGSTKKEYSVTPEDFGLKRVKFSDIKGGTPAESVKRMRELMDGAKGPYRDLVLLNSGAALYLCNRASTIAEGIKLAEETIDSGKVKALIARIGEVTNSYD